MISAKVAIIIYTTRKTRIEMTNMNNIFMLYRKRIHHPAQWRIWKTKEGKKSEVRKVADTPRKRLNIEDAVALTPPGRYPLTS